jgi:HPt (histidine-containing phosphotransfer) domain-containing protein
LQEALSTNDFKAAEIRIHTLKGVAANLGFLRLEFLCKTILDNLNYNKITLIQNNLKKLSEEYCKIIDILKKGQTI